MQRCLRGGLWSPITLAGLSILTIVHIVLNWKTAPPKRPLNWKQKIGVGLFTISTVIILIFPIGLKVVKYISSGASIKHALQLPVPIRTVKTSANKINLSPEFNAVIKAGKADRFFWVEQFKNYPDNKAVSEIITFETIHDLWETKQLDHMFNALRAQPELLYRYFAEMPKGEYQEFARYFSTLKPGTRQQIFAIFYKRLRDDILILENAGGVKEVLWGQDYRELETQCNRMEYLYANMVAMLNRTMSLEIGILPDGAVAPLPIISFTKEKSNQNFYKIFEDIIQKTIDKGYSVIIPSPANINLPEVAGLIGYYERDDTVGVSFYEENQSALLLQWVMKETDINNPLGHRVNDQELVQEAIRLCSNETTKTVDLFKTIATIGHYYKAMARDPKLILGGPAARGNQTGAEVYSCAS